MAKLKDLAQILEAVQAQLAALTERLERLEAASKPAMAPVSAPNGAPAGPVVQKDEPPAAPATPAITEEELLAISAALAAFLGCKVRIRQIRLLSSRAWAQQGRVSIQASHTLHS